MIFKHVSQTSCGDDGLWMSIQGDTIACYELSYWADLDSSHESKYNVQSGWIYLEDANQIRSALNSCGWEIDEKEGEDKGSIWCPYSGDIIARKGTKAYTYCIAECMWRYGAKDVVADVSGNNKRKLIQEARGAL